MLRILAVVAALALPASALAQGSGDPEPIHVMVLATYHMDNPGRDINNARIDPMTTPDKQAQLEALSQALARFQPTAIAIERVADDQSTLADQQWSAYAPEHLLTDNNERVQIAYRLADRLNLDRVYAVDEKDVEGEPSYFPINAVAAWAGEHGRMAEFQALSAPVRAYLARMESRQADHTVEQMLAEVNHPADPMVAGGQAFYYRLLNYGAGRDLPGADLNARWYARNVRIFAKLTQVARPGDRIILMFGAGHAYWLRHMVQTTPGYVLVEPTAYLAAAAD